MVTMLLIGGPKDGEWIPFENDQYSVFFQQYKPMKLFGKEIDEFSTCPTEIVRYRAEELAGHSKKFRVLVESSIDQDGLIELLLKGYRRPKDAS
jgi:hypothetical protein